MLRLPQSVRGLLRRHTAEILHLDDLGQALLLLGKLNAERVKALPPGTPLRDCEFKVFSQFGEDGIIQHLIRHVPIPNTSFIEFGVEAYVEDYLQSQKRGANVDQPRNLAKSVTVE